MTLTAEIVAVGTELVAGDAVDTNSAWLAWRLGELGIAVHRHASVDDDVARMVDVFGAALARADAVLVTGGLGPTPDDLTRHAAAQLAGVPLERRAELVDHLVRYFTDAGRDMPQSNLVQADLPAGARVLQPEGTAAGFALAVPTSSRSSTPVLYCLPGVPREMKAMAQAGVFGELAARAGRGVTVARLVRTAGMAESQVAELVDDVLATYDGDPPSVAYLASRGETRVRLTTTATDRTAALARIDPFLERVTARLGAGVAGLDDEGPEHAVVRQLSAAGLTLALGESMTAGGVGARIARVPGASSVFAGSLVTYATVAKSRLAGIDPAVIDAHGPVSPEAAAGLAAAARTRLGADVALGLVGVAGPDEQRAPVGRVHLALDSGAGLQERELNLPRRGRVELQEFAVSAAVDFLRRRLAGLATPERR